MTNPDLSLIPLEVLVDEVARRGDTAVVIVVSENYYRPGVHAIRRRWHGPTDSIVASMERLKLKLLKDEEATLQDMPNGD